jgi:hypothetical protein
MTASVPKPVTVTVTASASAVGELYYQSIRHASHAVVAHTLGARIVSAAADGADAVTVSFPPGMTAVELEDAHAAIWCAGSQGERYFGRGPSAVARITASDNARATAAVGGSATRFRQANALARRLVRKHWNTIHNIAADLFNRRTLRGAEFVAALTAGGRLSRAFGPASCTAQPLSEY